MNEKQHIVTIGGGTGTHTVLQGLKRYHKRLNLAAVVTMADSGGSTGRLRDEFGQLPVGDIRMALVALANENTAHEELLRKLFLYRFDKGEGLNGHNFGNLLLVALTDILGSEEAAIESAARVLGSQGVVHPVTTSSVDLVAMYDNGATLIGEHDIDEPSTEYHEARITHLSVTPDVTIAPRAEAAILGADMIVLGPGDLYTSVLANIVVPGAKEAIQHSTARLVYVANLMTKRGQTHGFGVEDHMREIEQRIGRPLDVVLYNDTPLPEELLERYAKEGEYPVAGPSEQRSEVVQMLDLLATETVRTTSGDTLRRSLIRHDSRKLAQSIVNLLIA